MRIKIFILSLLILISSCSHKNKDKDKEKETPQGVYSKAAQALRAKEYNRAADLFSKVTYEFPYYEGAKKAMIMEVYSQYLGHDYDGVNMTIENFIKTYPTASELDYMYYMRALSYYEQISNPYRDQSITFKTKQLLEKVLQRFPKTKYARDAKIKRDLVEDHLATHEMIIGRYYLNRGELLSALNRFNTIIKKYSTTSNVDEALYRVFEINRFVGNHVEAQKIAATLGFNYPNSRWYKSAYEILKHNRR